MNTPRYEGPIRAGMTFEYHRGVYEGLLRVLQTKGENGWNCEGGHTVSEVYLRANGWPRRPTDAAGWALFLPEKEGPAGRAKDFKVGQIYMLKAGTAPARVVQVTEVTQAMCGVLVLAGPPAAMATGSPYAISRGYAADITAMLLFSPVPEKQAGQEVPSAAPRTSAARPPRNGDVFMVPQVPVQRWTVTDASDSDDIKCKSGDGKRGSISLSSWDAGLYSLVKEGPVNEPAVFCDPGCTNGDCRHCRERHLTENRTADLQPCTWVCSGDIHGPRCPKRAEVEKARTKEAAMAKAASHYAVGTYPSAIDQEKDILAMWSAAQKGLPPEDEVSDARRYGKIWPGYLDSDGSDPDYVI